MALLNRLSIKWKLSLALIFSGLTLVLIYVVIAKSIFESDKITYVFDAQSSRLESLKREIEGRLEKDLLVSRSVVATFDFSRGGISDSGESIFHEAANLHGLELWNETKSRTLVKLEKEGYSLNASGLDAVMPPGQIALEPTSDTEILLSYRYTQSDGETFRLRALVSMNGLLPPGSPSQSIVLADGDRVLGVSDLRAIQKSTFISMLKDIKSGDSDLTSFWGEGKQRYLVSEKMLNISHLRLLSATPEQEALGALATLFNRSILFLFLSIFGLVFISLYLARGLTSNLAILTDAAAEIGRGNFDATPKIESKDEIGVLSQAFERMTQEIQVLLLKTRESARMEEELKTARLVQERLLPAAPSATMGELEIHGHIRTASETGGDWWYYFARGDDLYVAIADATGHGTPAALITAAARSVFSSFEQSDVSLLEMMQAWDQAIYSCAQKQVLMTGIILKIHSRTGKGRLISAAHETPYLLQAMDSGMTASPVDLPVTARLGDQLKDEFKEIDIELSPSDVLVLFTDGLFSVQRPDGTTLNERRFLKRLAGKADTIRSAQMTSNLIFQLFDDFRGDVPLPDDVGIVCLRRRGPEREVLLGDEDGTILSRPKST